MSPRDGQPPSPGDARDTPLLRKYKDLLHKHHALVRKLAERTDEHFSKYTLSTWALETSDSALALLSGDRVAMANSRWHALSRQPGHWRWRSSGAAAKAAEAAEAAEVAEVAEVAEASRTLGSLREVAMRESALLMAQAGTRVSRYQHVEDGRVLEVRTERMSVPGRTLVLLLARDVTLQARAEEELERARASMAEREHLRALGEMVSGIAHDLGNTLNAMRLRLELLRKHPSVASAPPAHLDALVRILTDASTRVGRLQSFSRQQPEGAGEQVRLEEMVRDAVDIARGDIEHRARRQGLEVRIEVDVPPLPPVRGSASDLRFVFLNLLLNARDAMPQGGTIHLRGRHEDGHVIFTVEDEGTGIPPQHLRDIFRPFFTTKGRQGTGLGLSMAYGVVSRAGGTLTAANRPQGGALFTLVFPSLTPPAPASLPAPSREPPRPRKQPKRRPAAPKRGGGPRPSKAKRR